MKKLLLILLSVILLGCSKDPLDKSVIELLEMKEIKYILKFEKENNYYGFESFYKDVQEFHHLTENDNLSKIEYEPLTYRDYFVAEDYNNNFELWSDIPGLDSTKKLIYDGGWKKIPKFLSIYDTLSSAQKVRDLIKKYPHIYIEWEVEEAMQIWLKKQIRKKRDSIRLIYSDGKNEKIKLKDRLVDKVLQHRADNMTQQERRRLIESIKKDLKNIYN